ncbi:hypothetical protein F511_41228 [Dorcoceras hygrometricum]|uniref:Uncharacterized protein n=1 Tax=Dorcoceras hygrometricum TaxID=472368 RepID=A0A2Z7BMS7_9LAMI|nr:hypothetical protein F511_41228 [Dorcoceras hygrometricum]
MPTCDRYSTCVRPLQSLRSAATVPAFGRYSTCVRPLQSLRSTATVPVYGRYSACVRPLQYHRAAATFSCGNHEFSTCVTLNGSGIQLAVDPQPLWLRNHNFGLVQWIMVKHLATSRHDPLGITDSACKNQLIVVSAQYGPFYTYIPNRSTTIGKSRVARDPIAMHTSWRSNSDIVSVTRIGYPRMKASVESSTTKHRLLHASEPHPIPLPNDPKGVGKRVKVRRLSCRVSMTFRVVRTNQYNQDLGLIHSTNDNHLESPNEGSSIDHQNKNIGSDEDEPEELVAKKAATKRRLAPAVVEPAAKKKRTTVGRAAPAEKDLAMIPVVQDPEPISIVPAATPKAQRRRAPKKEIDIQDRAAVVQTDILRKEMKDQKAALSQEFGDQLAAIRNDLIELTVESQQNYQTLSSQLSEIITYINRGGDAKRGKVVEVRSLLLTIEVDLERSKGCSVSRIRRSTGCYS